jgi:phage terminase large subunit-like protein
VALRPLRERLSFVSRQGAKSATGQAFRTRASKSTGLTYGGGYEGPGRSPDRADAMVWAMSELVRARAEPRLRRL